MSATKNINAEKIQGNLSLDSVSGVTISGGTIYSGSTDLSDLFVTSNVSIQPGININTGGTASNPIINLDDDISLNSISANTISGGTFYGDGSNLSGISTDNFYVTGGTFSSQILTLERNDGNNVLVSGFTDFYTTGGTYDNNTSLITFERNDGNSFDVDLSSIDVNDTFVTGQTFNSLTYNLSTSRNDGVTINTDLSSLASDVYVVSGVYNISTGIVTYTNSTGGTFQVSGFTTGMTDSYTTAANLNGETIEFDNNIQGGNLYSVNLSPVLSGKTDLTLFDAHTGDTNNPHQTTFGNLISTAHTHTISDVTNLQTELDSKIQNGINSGGGNEVFSGKSGTDLYFRTLSGGTNTTITTIGDIINIDVTTSNMPQAQKLYVDSENGTDVTTSGELGQPFLTPEYALNQIDNTGIITGDTNSNTTISGISDIDNDKLEVGMYLYGSGVLFGSVIVSKGNEGSDSNTITISKNVSSSNTNVSIDFIKIYELVLNGTFNVNSRTLFKEGVWIRNNGLVNYSTYNLFNLGTQVLKAPYKILGKGDYNGLDNVARFMSTSANQLSDFTLDVEFGNIYTVYTGTVFNVNIGSNNSYIKIKGNYVSAAFGVIGTFQSSFTTVNFNGYGLLGGITGSSIKINGAIICPSSVSCLNVNYATINGRFVGSITASNSELVGSFNGTTLSLTSCSFKTTSNSSFVNGSYSSTIFHLKSTVQLGSTSCTFSGSISKIFGNLNFNSLDITINTGAVLENHASFTTSWFSNSITILGKFVNYSSKFTLGHVIGFTVSTSGQFCNYGDFPLNITINGVGAIVDNYGNLSGNISISNDSILYNRGSIRTASGVVTLNNDLAKFENYGSIESDSLNPTISKIRGLLQLHAGTKIKTATNVSPIKIGISDSGTATSTLAFKLIQSGQNFLTTVGVGFKVHNTTDDTWATVTNVDGNTQLTLDTDIFVSGENFNIYGTPDVYYFYAVSNCDGTTYGLLKSFDGIAPEPNDLVGGTLFENVNY